MADDDDSNMLGSSFSLVRYNNPVLIDKHSETPSPTPTQGAKGGKPGKGGEDSTGGQPSKSRPKSAGDTASEASIAAKQRSETEEILDSILPPREWEEGGQLWRQSVSSTPATRLDVINLQVCLSMVDNNFFFAKLTKKYPFKLIQHSMITLRLVQQQ